MEEVKEEEDVTMGINRGVEHDLLSAGEGLRFFASCACSVVHNINS